MGDTRDYMKALAVAALSKVNIFTIGEPGGGKTYIAKQMLATCFPGASGYITVDESTPPSRVIGDVHLPSLMEGRKVMDTTGTLKDPTMRAFLIDELSRAGGPLMDALLDPLTQRIPVVVACSNWLPKQARFEAMLDRFGIIFELRQKPLASEDLNALVPQMMADWQFGVEELQQALEAQTRTNEKIGKQARGWAWPSYDEIMQVWQAVPTPDDLAGIADVLKELAIEFEAKGVQINRRKASNVTAVLHAVSCYDNGMAAGYKQPTKSAMNALVHLFPETELIKIIKRVASSVGDPVGMSINGIRTQLEKLLTDIVNASDQERVTLVVKHGAALNDLRTQLSAIGDSRADALGNAAQAAFMSAFTVKGPINLPTLADLAKEASGTPVAAAQAQG